MMTIRSFQVVLFFCLVTFSVSSQKSFDFLNLNHSIYSNSQFKNKVGEASLRNFDLNFVTPTLKIKTKTKINNVIYYRLSQYDYKNLPPETIQLPKELHEIKYTLLVRHAFNQKYEMLFVPRFNIRSDFKAKFGNKDMFPAISAILMKTSQKNENFKWGIGLNYNNDLGKNSLLPIIAFKYSSEKTRFNAYFPNNATLTFFPSKKTEYGIAFISDAILSHISTVDGIDYLRTLNVNLNPTFSYNLTSNIWLNLKAGLVLSRKYDLYNNNFETPSVDFESKLKPSAYAQIGFSFRSNE